MEATFQGVGQEKPVKPNENAICRNDWPSDQQPQHGIA
jgi:hypothetical protein